MGSRFGFNGDYLLLPLIRSQRSMMIIIITWKRKHP
jgi:hypothetical protein